MVEALPLTELGCVSKTWLSYYHITFSVIVTGATVTLLTRSVTEYKERVDFGAIPIFIAYF